MYESRENVKTFYTKVFLYTYIYFRKVLQDRFHAYILIHTRNKQKCTIHAHTLAGAYNTHAQRDGMQWKFTEVTKF